MPEAPLDVTFDSFLDCKAMSVMFVVYVDGCWPFFPHQLSFLFLFLFLYETIYLSFFLFMRSIDFDQKGLAVIDLSGCKDLFFFFPLTCMQVISACARYTHSAFVCHQMNKVITKKHGYLYLSISSFNLTTT